MTTFTDSANVPVSTPVAPEVPATDVKSDHRKGSRKTVNPDGSISYGFKKDGTPKKRPGRSKVS